MANFMNQIKETLLDIKKVLTGELKIEEEYEDLVRKVHHEHHCMKEIYLNEDIDFIDDVS